MQNRYTGDIGDFSKLGLLRALEAAVLSIGLNWYLTPDETHNSDGRHIGYLSQEQFRACDEGLWLGLKDIVAGERQIHHMETDSILRATFYSACLDFRGLKKPERIARRSEWFAASLSAIAGKDIICVDPDNGLVVHSAKGGPRENKYVLPSELAAYYAQGATVICYQHKARRKDPFYAKRFEGLLTSGDFPGAGSFALKFKTTSQRYYLFLIQPRHADVVGRVASELLAGPWSKHFCPLHLKGAIPLPL